MAKRFTDTELYDRAWYRKLSPRLKCAWEWLNKRCDVVGVWNVDMDRLSFEIGESISIDELTEAFKVVVFESDKLFIPGFVPFQYGDESGRLSPKNKFHLSIAQKLQARGFTSPEFKSLDEISNVPPMGVDTLTHGGGTPQGRGQGQGKGKGQGKGQGRGEGGAGGNKFPVDAGNLQACLDEWRGTLRHFQIERAVSQRDELAIGKAIQDYGSEWVLLAFQGARKQTKSPRFDPKHFVSLSIYLHKERIERLVNIGAGTESAENMDWASFWKKVDGAA